jgi:2,3-bisphosphoglycerate-independent phosphoglycerate mutase
MKIFMLVPDGCADWPIPALGGKTPLETADLANINKLAQISHTGLVKTVPDGVAPGSDAASLAILGYDPATCLTGRAPLEAAAMGIQMAQGETAFRASLVTLGGSGAYEDLTVDDHSAGEIGEEEARELIGLVDKELGGEGLRFFPGVSYRCLLITNKLNADCSVTPPHDILGKRAGDYLPEDPEIRRLMEASHRVLKGRRANSIWLWGQGGKMTLPTLTEKYGVRGSMIAAVNLLKGIGHSAGLDCPDIPGATGTLHTNYANKAAKAIESFEKGADFVFVHVEAPDECSHTGDMEGKVWSLGEIDRKIFAPVYEYLRNTGEPYRIIVLPDHETPLEIRTHTSNPVPFVMYDSQTPLPADPAKTFSEACGAKGRFIGSGAELAGWLFGRTPT